MDILLKPMVEGVHENFQAIGKEEDIFTDAKLTADSGFHTEKNMEMLLSGGIDAYLADTLFWKRDPRFTDYGHYKERTRKEREERLSLMEILYGITSSYEDSEYAYHE